jgi:hypothetical protein
MAQLIHLAVTALSDYLEAQLITAITDPTDVSKAIVVKAGRLQDDPTVNFIHILVHPGDPEEPEAGWDHQVVGRGDTDKLGTDIYFPGREVGGGTTWWRRGTIQIGCYFLTQGYNRGEARATAHVVLGRLEKYVESCPGALGLTDQFGETSLALQCVKSRFTESGGPPDQFIWRGKVWFQILTAKD